MNRRTMKRPIKPLKTHVLHVRATEADYDKIVSYCENNEIFISSFIIKSCRYVINNKDWKEVYSDTTQD